MFAHLTNGSTVGTIEETLMNEMELTELFVNIIDLSASGLKVKCNKQTKNNLDNIKMQDMWIWRPLISLANCYHSTHEKLSALYLNWKRSSMNPENINFSASRASSTSGGRYNEGDAKIIVEQILKVVAFCHLQGVVHRDLKPENFLFSTREEHSPMKIIDFDEAECSITLLSILIYGSFSPQLMHGNEDEDAIDPEEDKAELKKKRKEVAV
ncbi:hypothetical protein ACJX0J_024742, partial [Zea mays]